MERVGGRINASVKNHNTRKHSACVCTRRRAGWRLVPHTIPQKLTDEDWPVAQRAIPFPTRLSWKITRLASGSRVGCAGYFSFCADVFAKVWILSRPVCSQTVVAPRVSRVLPGRANPRPRRVPFSRPYLHAPALFDGVLPGEGILLHPMGELIVGAQSGVKHKIGHQTNKQDWRHGTGCLVRMSRPLLTILRVVQEEKDKKIRTTLDLFT